MKVSGRKLISTNSGTTITPNSYKEDDAAVWNEKVGPFYDATTVRKLLGLYGDELEMKVESSRLMALQTSDNVMLYPVWQFSGRKILKGWESALRAFENVHVSSWLIATWAVTPDTETLGGLSPIDWLRIGNPVEPVVADAEKHAARWAQ